MLRLCRADDGFAAGVGGASVGAANVCAPFTLLGNACAASSHRGCRTFAALCRRQSIVRQCVASVVLPLPPTADDARAKLAAVCAALAFNPTPELCGAASPTSTTPTTTSTTTTTTTTETTTTAISNPVTIANTTNPFLAYAALCALPPITPEDATPPELCESARVVCAARHPAAFPCRKNISTIQYSPFLHASFAADRVLFDWAIPGSSQSSILAAIAVAFAFALSLEAMRAIRRVVESKLKLLTASIPAASADLDSASTTPGFPVDANANADEEAAVPLLLHQIRASVFSRAIAFQTLLIREAKMRGLRSLVKALEGQLELMVN
ncbi:hypothetical protein HK100_012298 [Physocladia obscura]|uniref:Uncharacterized protein n=1 Tax=Physocladia obscura TaxID=109957 RepID=A0AAD5T0W4_9FUNG|nr:hypothetical protein HK100_012298 [Physocladia obscura]